MRVLKMYLLIRIQKVPPKYRNVDYFAVTAVSRIKTHFWPKLQRSSKSSGTKFTGFVAVEGT